jgi:hemerythrin-like metal-binding protein
MKKIIWGDQFSVGVKEMDVQHQRVIKIFNRLVDNARDDARSEKVSEALAELVEYASEHFKCEEKLLRDHGHPDLAHQEREHRAFRRQVGELCLIAFTEDESVVHDLLAFLHDWWTNHILVEDKKYATLALEGRKSYRADRFALGELSVTRHTEFDR